MRHSGNSSRGGIPLGRVLPRRTGNEPAQLCPKSKSGRTLCLSRCQSDQDFSPVINLAPIFASYLICVSRIWKSCQLFFGGLGLLDLQVKSSLTDEEEFKQIVHCTVSFWKHINTSVTIRTVLESQENCVFLANEGRVVIVLGEKSLEYHRNEVEVGILC